LAAILRRESGDEVASSGAAAIIPEVISPAPEPVAAEPAGWAAAVEPVTTPVASVSAEPTPSPAASVSPSPSPSADPSPSAAPVETPPVQQVSTPATPAGWYPDPSGRFEMRYWDGATWTEHVARGGQQFTDPPVA
jgi:Protein of unknown function (DUF2510)